MWELSGWRQAGDEPAACPGSEAGSGTALKEFSQETEGGDITHYSTARYCVQFRAARFKKDFDQLGKIKQRPSGLFRMRTVSREKGWWGWAGSILGGFQEPTGRSPAQPELALPRSWPCFEQEVG